MKKVVMSLLVLLAVGSPAQALPGWKLPEIKTWLGKHRELVNVHENLPSEGHWFIGAQRYLGGGDRLEIMYDAPLSDKPHIDQNEADYDAFGLSVRKGYDDAGREGLQVGHELVRQVWQLDSMRAYELLESLHGRELAEDFKHASFEYEGMDYKTPDKLLPFPRVKILTLPESPEPLAHFGPYRFYRGRLYGYEISGDGSELKIYRLGKYDYDISVIQHNAQMNEKHEARYKGRGYGD